MKPHIYISEVVHLLATTTTFTTTTLFAFKNQFNYKLKKKSSI